MPLGRSLPGRPAFRIAAPHVVTALAPKKPTRGGSQAVWLAALEAEARQLLDAWATEGERSWNGLELRG